MLRDHADPAGAGGRAEDLSLTVARLQARVDTMPLIEQAKGIIMAKSGLSGDRAFAWLKEVSQQRNVPIRVLAAEMASSVVHDPQPQPYQQTGSG